MPIDQALERQKQEFIITANSKHIIM